MPALDFATARMKHMNWKLKLRSFLDGRESLTEAQATSPKDCDLGKWMYSEGMTQYGKYPEMKDLEKAHNELHATVKKIVQAKNGGRATAAEQEYKKIEPISAKIDSLLAALEKKLADQFIHK